MCLSLNLQGSIVLLKSPRLSPRIAMTGIVKRADKALTKWDQSRWGHGLLFKMTFRDKVKLPDLKFIQLTKLTFMVILFQSSESDKEED